MPGFLLDKLRAFCLQSVGWLAEPWFERGAKRDGPYRCMVGTRRRQLLDILMGVAEEATTAATLWTMMSGRHVLHEGCS